jgi:predicted nucleic acid-binding protein
MTALIDSSAWLDYFLAEKRGKPVRELLQSGEEILASSVNLFEVYFKLMKFFPSQAEENRLYLMSRCKIIPADKEIVLEAARIKLRRGLSFADSTVWATAERHNARLVTSDADFKGYKQLELLR